MSSIVTARLPDPLVERLDERASQELRSRSGMVAYLIAQGLESAPAPDTKED